ncbi:MAG: radical SAM protein [Anaerolineae bacterium]|nr:radical SAM protein [Anaerolineae bacterium]MDQ7035547.1 radical SAM protein [Anaerolineae bacterium]
MSDILFGQSYYLRFDKKLWDAMQPYPPLGTLYAASFMREQGFTVGLFDAMLAKSTVEWNDALIAHQPRYAVIFEDNFNYLSKMSLLRMREAAFEMIGYARAQDCIIIVAGADMSDHTEKYLERGADYVLLGEGEETLAELVNYLEAIDTVGNRPSENNLYQIQSLAYMQHGKVIKTPPRPVIRTLDDMPFPAWDLVDRDKYRAIWYENHGYFSMNLVTTRGCPFHCNWCAKPIWGQKYNSRSPLTVVQEMKWLKENFQPDHIWFVDDIMGIRDLWIEEFADLLDEHDAHIPFKSLNRADLLLRGKTIPALARAGADIIWIGAESGSQKILDAMDKGTQVEQIYEATKKAHEHGIKVAFFLQFGYPSETREDIELTLQMVRDLMPDDIGISVSYPLPGTPFYETVRSELGRENWYDSQDMAMLYQGPFRTGFYRQLHKVVHKDYRSRKTWQNLRSWLLKPHTLRPSHLRQIASMIYHRLTLALANHELDKLSQLPHEPTKLPNVVLDDMGYPPNYFEETYGSLADDPIERGEQPPMEIRDDI